MFLQYYKYPVLTACLRTRAEHVPQPELTFLSSVCEVIVKSTSFKISTPVVESSSLVCMEFNVFNGHTTVNYKLYREQMSLIGDLISLLLA